MIKLSNIQHIRIAILLSVLLFILSMSIDPDQDYIYFRGLRALTAFSFLASLLVFEKSRVNSFALGFVFLHGFSSLLSIWYENDNIACITMLLNAIGFLLLLILIRSKVTLKRLDPIIIIAISVSAIVFGWLSFSFVEVLFDYIVSIPLLVIISIQMTIVYILHIYAFIYLNETNTGSSVLFVMFLILIVFSETFRGIGYYKIVDSALGQYTARFLLLGSYCFIYFFCFHINDSGKLLSKRDPSKD